MKMTMTVTMGALAVAPVPEKESWAAISTIGLYCPKKYFCNAQLLSKDHFHLNESNVQYWEEVHCKNKAVQTNPNAVSTLIMAHISCTGCFF